MRQMMADAQRACAAGINPFFETDTMWATLPASPITNVREFSDRYEVLVSMPDVTEEDIEYRVDGRILSLTVHYDKSDTNHYARQIHSGRLLFPGAAPDPNAILVAESDQIRLTFPKMDSRRADAAPQ